MNLSLKRFYLIFLLINLIDFSNSLELNCVFLKFSEQFEIESDEFFPFNTDYGYEDLWSSPSLALPISDYECVAKNLTTTLENRTVVKINGDHAKKKSIDDVQIVSINLQNTPFLPLKIGDHFKNIKRLSVHKSNVQFLMKGDLNGLESLEDLSLKNNPIKQIGHDFFKGIKNLKYLNLAECHLKMIDAKALQPLIKLVEVDFRYNNCIAKLYTKTSFDEMKNVIKSNCQGFYETFSFEEECKQKDEHKKSTSTTTSVFLIFTIIILSFIIVIFIYALIKIRKELQKGSWNEMAINSVQI